VTDTVLVTGALGCLGAWTCKALSDDGATVVAYDLGDDPYRLRLALGHDALERITLVRGDVTDLDQLGQTMAEHCVTHVIHLAALQVPFCKADPPLGARVNVLGTVCIFEAAKHFGLKTTIAYASSAAVYDAGGTKTPTTLYGVYKLANEGTARLHWQEAGLASVGLRPFVVYGPGRDQGLTAEPTHAMRAAANGEPYRITFGGRTELHYAPDVARAFVLAAHRPPAEATVYDVSGESTEMSEIAAAIESAADVAPGSITFGDDPLPFPGQLPGERFDAPVTPLAEGIRDTVAHFRAA
jgi:nucleoside-diphosphate-sugar epimerase